jgi:hypothetical protein
MMFLNAAVEVKHIEMAKTPRMKQPPLWRHDGHVCPTMLHIYHISVPRKDARVRKSMHNKL